MLWQIKRVSAVFSLGSAYRPTLIIVGLGRIGHVSRPCDNRYREIVVCYQKPRFHSRSHAPSARARGTWRLSGGEHFKTTVKINCLYLECKDLEGWTDSDGDGCDQYPDEYGCSFAGPKKNSDGIDAYTACCSCGGGENSPSEEILEHGKY